MDDEVVRIEQVKHLQGATGHGVASLLFLVAGGVAFGFGLHEVGWMTAAGAFLVTANGLSIYAWDVLRDRFRPDAVETDDGIAGGHNGESAVDTGNAVGTGNTGGNGSAGATGSAGGTAGAGSDRTLQPHTLSGEMRAELAAGFVIVGSLACFLVALSVALDHLRPRTVAYLLFAGLGVGNLVAVLRASDG